MSAQRVSRKIILAILLFLIFAPFPTYAAEPSGSVGEVVGSNNYKAPQNTDYSVINLQHSILCQLAGTSPAGKCMGITKERGRIVSYLYDKTPGGGASGVLSSAFVALYTNPPTSTAEYLADIGKDFGIVSPAYAQVPGSGQNIIAPVRLIWQVIRNLTYMLFILVFIVVGLMIMFRQKLNQQTVVSIQAALPGLVIGLILVTFSYFISALIIDMSFVGTQLVGQVFIQVKNPATNRVLNAFDDGTGAGIQDILNKSNVFQLFTSSFRYSENFYDIGTGVTGTLFSGVGWQGMSVVSLLSATIGGLTGLLAAGPITIPLTIIGAGLPIAAIGLVSLLVPVVLIVALIIQMFRLFFKLVTAYIMILVTTVASPLIILFSSLPGQGGILSFWWKGLLANALIFPAVLLVFMFAGVILATSPLDWTGTPPLFGDISTELLRMLIAYGIILGSPAIPDLVKKAIGVKDLGEISAEALKGATLGGLATLPIGIGAGRSAIKARYTVAKYSPTQTPALQAEAKLYENIFGGQKWFKP